MIFFFDANFPEPLAKAVQIITAPKKRQYTVVVHDDRFPRGTTDVFWIEELARSDPPKPIVVGGDGAILRRPAEAAALRESGLSYFILVKGFPELPLYEQASKFFHAWPTILELSSKLRAPTVFEVSVNGKVERKFATSEVHIRTGRGPGAAKGS